MKINSHHNLLYTHMFYCLLVVILNELYSFMLINKDASTI